MNKDVVGVVVLKDVATGKVFTLNESDADGFCEDYEEPNNLVRMD